MCKFGVRVVGIYSSESIGISCDLIYIHSNKISEAG